MNCGRLWETKGISSGFGWRQTSKPEKLWGCTWEIAVEIAHKDDGRLYRRSIDSALSLTPIFGLLMRKSSPVNDIKVWVRRVAKRVTSSGLTVSCADGCHVYSGRRYRFPRNWRTILGQFGILFTTTMHPYLFSTILDKFLDLTRINFDTAFMEAAIVQRLSEPEIGAARLGLNLDSIARLACKSC